MAKNSKWYVDNVIVPWRERNKAVYAVVTNDTFREQNEIGMQLAVDMAKKVLADNAFNRFLGGITGDDPRYPLKVEYYTVESKPPSGFVVEKLEFFIKPEELENAMTRPEMLEVLERYKAAKDEYDKAISRASRSKKGKGKNAGVAKKLAELNKAHRDFINAFKSSGIKTYVRGLVPSKSGRVPGVVTLSKAGARLPDPLPMALENTGNKIAPLHFKEADDASQVGVLPAQPVVNILMDMFLFNIDRKTRARENRVIITNLQGFRLASRKYNEEVGVVPFLKSVTQDRRVLRAGHAVLVTVPSIDVIPEELRDHVEIIDKSLPTREEIRELLEHDINVWKAQGLLRSNVTVTDELVVAATGMTLEQIKGALHHTAYLYHEIRPEVFRDRKMQILKHKGVKYVEPKITFNEVGGMKILKNTVQDRFVRFFEHPEELKKIGVGGSRGFLMAGIGGTGKTWFATALAGELGRPVIVLNVADFMTKYYSESGKNLQRILDIADRMGAVVFVDEIDSIATKRNDTQHEETRRVLNTFMAYLGKSDRNAIVIGATNRPQDLDPNFLRPGRFDKVFVVNPPDEEARKEILKIHAEKLYPEQEMKVESEVYDYVAQKTNLWTSAELEALVREAKLSAYFRGSKTVTQKDFDSAMNNIRINMKGRLNMMKEIINAMEELEQAQVDPATLNEAKRMVAGDIGVVSSYGDEPTLSSVNEDIDIDFDGVQNNSGFEDVAVETEDVTESEEESEDDFDEPEL